MTRTIVLLIKPSARASAALTALSDQSEIGWLRPHPQMWLLSSAQRNLTPESVRDWILRADPDADVIVMAGEHGWAASTHQSWIDWLKTDWG